MSVIKIEITNQTDAGPVGWRWDILTRGRLIITGLEPSMRQAFQAAEVAAMNYREPAAEVPHG
jgi:hypothetical protein